MCSKILYSNIRGLSKNRKKLGDVANSEHCDVLLCSETMVNGPNPIIAKYYIKGYKKAILRESNTVKNPRARGMVLYIKKDSENISSLPIYECECHETLVVKVSSSRNFYILASYRNPNLDDSIYSCLLLMKSEIQRDDPNGYFIFVGDYNAHHREWLNSVSPTDSHGKAALNFEKASGCNQIINEPTHLSGNCLDLLYTNAIVTCNVSNSIGSSDHNAIIFTIQTEKMGNVVASQPCNLIGFESESASVVSSYQHLDWDVIVSDIRLLDWDKIHRNPNSINKLNDELTAIMDKRNFSTISFSNMEVEAEREKKKKKTKVKKRTAAAVGAVNVPDREQKIPFKITSTEIKTLLLNLDEDSSDLSSIFLKKTANVLAPHIARIFRLLLRKNQLANFPSSSPICLILSNIFKTLLYNHLCNSMTITSI